VSHGILFAVEMTREPVVGTPRCGVRGQRSALSLPLHYALWLNLNWSRTNQRPSFVKWIANSSRLADRSGSFMTPVKIWLGYPYPLGATWLGNGVNFALFSEVGTSVDLCLFDNV